VARAHEERQTSEISVAINDPLARALIERAGIERLGGGAWAAPDGRQTSVAAEALVWALVLLAA
jgi:hypothetical protein